MHGKSIDARSLLPLAFITCTGCTTAIEVDKLGDNSHADGLVYYLPIARFDVEVTREIKDCFAGKEMSKAEYRRFLNADPTLITMDISAKVTPRYIADATQPYLWRYPALDEKTKITDVSVDLYDNGTLKSINASVDDQTAEITTNVVQGVASLVATHSGVFVPITPNFNTAKRAEVTADKPDTDTKKIDVPSFCTPQVHLALKEKNQRSKRIKSIDTEARAIKTGKTLPDACKAQSGAKQNACIDRRLTELDEEKRVLNGEIAKYVKLLRAQTTHIKVPDFIEPGTKDTSPTVRQEWLDQLPVTPQRRAQWFNLTPPIVAERQDDLHKLFNEQRASTDLHMRVTLAGDSAKPGDIATAVAQSTGLVYRQPVDALLHIEQKSAPDLQQSKHLVDTIVSVPQAGMESRLPLVNEPFDENSLTAAFAPSGALTKFGFDSKAGAEAASKTFLDSALVLQKLKEAKASKGQVELERETALIEAETALLKAKKARQEAEDALQGNDG